MEGYKKFRKKAVSWMRPWTPEENMEGVSVAGEDTAVGSPKDGDYIAINANNPADRWLVGAAYFEKNFEPAE